VLLRSAPSIIFAVFRTILGYQGHFMQANLGLKSQARNPAYGRSLDQARASRSMPMAA